MCLPALINLRTCEVDFLKQRLINTRCYHGLGDGQLTSVYRPSQSISSFSAASVMLCCSALPSCSSTPLRPSVGYTSIRLVVNIMCVKKIRDHPKDLYCFDQKDSYRFEVRLEVYDSNVRVVVSPSSFLSSHPPTPPLIRWPAPITSAVSCRLVTIVWS